MVPRSSLTRQRFAALIFLSLLAALFVGCMTSVAHADPVSPTGATPPLPDTVQQWINYAIGTAVAAALGWISVHVGPKISKWFGAKGDAAAQSAKAWLADHAIAYAKEQEHKAGEAIGRTALAKEALAFLAKQGVVGDAAKAVMAVVEARLNVQRNADDALAAVKKNAEAFDTALTTGQLGKDIATIEASQDKAVRAAKLPPTPPAGTGG